MRRQDGEEGERNVGFSVPADITQAVKALIDLLLEEAAEPTRRRLFWCEEMEAERRSSRRWKVLREKLKLRGIGCCGSSWSSAALDGDDMGAADGEEEGEAEAEAEARDVCTPHHHDTEMERTESIEEEEEEEEEEPPRVDEQDQEAEEPPREEEEEEEEEENQDFERSRTGETENETTEAEAMLRREATMNLAAALAAERHLRAAQDCQQTESGQPPFRVSLMALLEQEHEGGNGNDNNKKKKKGSRGAEEWPGAGCCSCCCVCMSREKGAAFIPCGHTFCRACSRELWLNRGSCPLCNRQILEILDIF